MNCNPGKIIFFILLFSLQTLFAQISPEYVKREIEKTQQLLDNSSNKIQESGSRMAMNIFHDAQAKQILAHNYFSSKRYTEALGATLLSRKLCLKSLEVVEHRIKARRVVSRSGEFIRHTEPTIRESGNETAIELLDRGIEIHKNSLKALEEESYILAVKLSFRSAELIEKALKLVLGKKVNPKKVKQEIERTVQLVNRVRTLLQESPNEEAENLLQKSIEIQERSKELFEEKKFILALKFTLSARELTVKALRMVERPLSSEKVKNSLSATEELLKRVGSKIKDCENSEAKTLFSRSLEHQKSAWEFYEKRDYKQSLAKTTIAKRLCLKAMEICGIGSEIERIEEK